MKSFTEISTYLDTEGRVTVWPSKRDRNGIVVLEYLATKFAVNQIYTEKEVNERLNEYHTFADPALLRREMVGMGFLSRTRDCSAYWLNFSVY